MKRFISLIIAVLLLLSLTSCEKNQQAVETEQPDSVAEPSSAVKEPEKYTISLIVYDGSSYFYHIKAGCEQAVEELKEQDVDITFSFVYPVNDEPWLSQVYESIINGDKGKKDAVLLCPANARIDKEAFALAKEKEVKTILLDSTTTDNNWDAAYLTTIDYDKGLLAGKLMLEQLNAKGITSGKIYLFNSDSIFEKERGFRWVFKDTDFELCYINNAHFYSDVCDDVLEDDVNNEIVGAVCPNYFDVYYILEGLNNHNRADTVIVESFDLFNDYYYNIEQQSYFEDGLDVCINPDPYQMGYQAIMGAVELLRGNEVNPNVVDIPPIIVTKDNYKEYFADIDKQLESTYNSSTEIVKY